MLYSSLLKKDFSFILIISVFFLTFFMPVFAAIYEETDIFTKYGLDRAVVTYTSPDAIPIDDYIIVTMENEYSFPEEDYSSVFFGIEYVENVKAVITFIPNIGIDPKQFHRIEILYLTDFGKQNIDLFINELTNRAEILIAEKGYRTKNASDMIIPNDTYSQIKQWLLESVDVFDDLSNDVKTSGRLNTFRAVRKAAGYLMGGANLDGNITPEDARQVLRWAVGMDSYTNLNEALCDVDYSNDLDPEDSRLILRMATGIIPQIE